MPILLFSLGEYEMSGKLYNENKDLADYCKYESLFAVISNYKIGNDSLASFWIDKYWN